ncbi:MULTISPECIES: hypothetical protein [Pantoea]|uniref:hypothetical protein n=1 Tax=Pantoea TaxID=53335 RepID=UPI00137A5062|nr:hypothetical protein [Pantoea ananatis]UYL01550.1 hypothetical protein NG830_20515 [Pantoea ananatis]
MPVLAKKRGQCVGSGFGLFLRLEVPAIGDMLAVYIIATGFQRRRHICNRALIGGQPQYRHDQSPLPDRHSPCASLTSRTTSFCAMAARFLRYCLTALTVAPGAAIFSSSDLCIKLSRGFQRHRRAFLLPQSP